MSDGEDVALTMDLLLLAPYQRLAFARAELEEVLRTLHDRGCYLHELRQVLDAISSEFGTLERQRDIRCLDMFRAGASLADALKVRRKR